MNCRAAAREGGLDHMETAHKGVFSPPAGGVPRGEAQRSGFDAIRKNGGVDVKLSGLPGKRNGTSLF